MTDKSYLSNFQGIEKRIFLSNAEFTSKRNDCLRVVRRVTSSKSDGREFQHGRGPLGGLPKSPSVLGSLPVPVEKCYFYETAPETRVI